MLELLTLVCWAAALGIQALGVGTQQARVVAISIVLPMATAAAPPVVVVVVVMAAQLLALEIKLNNSHGFGLQWLLQLCIFYQANKLFKLCQRSLKKSGQKQWGRRIGEYCKQNDGSLYKNNGQDPTRDHLKNTLIENLS